MSRILRTLRVRISFRRELNDKDFRKINPQYSHLDSYTLFSCTGLVKFVMLQETDILKR